jgi:chemotaxis protein methyltransferase CheR
MKNKLPDNLLSQLSEFISAATALQFSPERWDDLDRRAGYAAEEFSFHDKEAFVHWLLTSSLNKEQLEILTSHLTVSETYFWREPRIFEALEEHILPGLIRSRANSEKSLRIWSAACATGEEPYSIAIALKRMIHSLSDWNITILATDINTRVLRKAQAGIYGKWSFRNAPPWLDKIYFHRLEDGRLEIIPEIREMVNFEYLNLSEDIYPSHLNNTNGMDLIFCRNVLMYFSPEHNGRIGNRLHGSLVEGGWLIVGSSELSGRIFPQFASVHFPGATVYRKMDNASRSPVKFHIKETEREKVLPQFPVDKPRDAEPVFSSHTQEPVKEDITHIAIDPVKKSMPSAHACIQVAVEKQEEYGAPKPAITFSVRNLADQGRLVEALALCEKALNADKLDPEMHYLRAIILHERNDEEEAIASLKRALYVSSEFIPANFLLGNLLLRRGNIHAGKGYLQHVVTLLKNHPHEDILPESDGLTAGRLREIIEATMRLKIEGIERIED